ncbi:MAG: RadC family protein, partial [Cytophagales bacterium]
HRNKEDRPREKLIRNGKNTLSKAELLGLVIGSGIEGTTSVDLAREILAAYDNNLSKIAQLSVAELCQFKGIGHAKASLILSVMELAVRFERDIHGVSRKKITNAEDIYRYMKLSLRNKLTEEFWVILLNIAGYVIKAVQISKGGLSRTIVDPRMVFKACLIHNAVGFVLVHNHPSGNVEPSQADIQLTMSIQKGSKVFGLRMVDHLIFGDRDFFSFEEAHMLGV